MRSEELATAVCDGLIGKRIAEVLAGNITGSVVQLGIGETVTRILPPGASERAKKNCGQGPEFAIMLNRDWLFECDARRLVSDGDDGDVISDSLGVLIGKTVRQVDIDRDSGVLRMAVEGGTVCVVDGSQEATRQAGKKAREAWSIHWRGLVLFPNRWGRLEIE